MKCCTYLVLIFICTAASAQQQIPIELLSAPDKYNFAISGILTGNIDEDKLDVNTKKGQTSGKVFLDAYVTPKLFTSIHINAVKKTFNKSVDSFDLANLSFIHNDYKFNFAIAWQHQAKYTFYKLFFDYSISELDLEKQVINIEEQYSLNTFKLNLGVQVFWKADWDQNLVVNAALKVNKMWLEDNPADAAALEKAFAIDPADKFIRKYNGFSFKTTIQLNTISIFCETQRNFSAFKGGTNKAIPGFTNHTFYSIGFTTTSTAILGKRKNIKVNPTPAAPVEEPAEENKM